VAFSLFVTLAGGNVIAVRYISCEACELDPFWAAATRFLLGSLIFAAIALVLRTGMASRSAFVLRRWTASAVSYEGVLIPLVAIVLAWWLQDERITSAFAAGSVLVLIGVYVGALRRPSAEQVPEAVRVPSER
jgi:drug/metabolite transporter (DMT)-like permease